MDFQFTIIKGAKFSIMILPMKKKIFSEIFFNQKLASVNHLTKYSAFKDLQLYNLVEQSYPNNFLKPLLLIPHRVLSPVRLCTWMSSASFSGLSLSTYSRHFLVTDRSRGVWGDSDLMATRTSTRRCLASLQCE